MKTEAAELKHDAQAMANLARELLGAALTVERLHNDGDGWECASNLWGRAKEITDLALLMKSRASYLACLRCRKFSKRGAN